jgi:uncharacterized protein with GYD domain
VPHYVILVKYTPAGAGEINTTLSRTENFRTNCESHGGKFIAQYWTTGQYDEVRIVELPNDETLAEIMFYVQRRGSVTMESMRAFTEEDMKGIMANLPAAGQTMTEAQAARRQNT